MLARHSDEGYRGHMRARAPITRLAVSIVFAVVGILYLQRPDLGTVVGVVGTGAVAAITWWNPKRELATWQTLTVLLGLPFALLFQVEHESAAEQLLGGLLFGNGGPLEAFGILAAAVAMVFGVMSLSSPRAQRATAA